MVKSSVKGSGNGAGAPQDDGYKAAPGGGDFPPFCLLGVGHKVSGEIVQVRVSDENAGKSDKKKQPLPEKIRAFYEIKLDAECQAFSQMSVKDPKKNVEAIYDVGQTVTLPGAGSLDRRMKAIALEVQGQAQSTEVEGIEATQELLSHLAGVSVKVERKENDKMKKGTFAGNAVKVYSVFYKTAVLA